ncbi:cerebellin 20 [Clupea harengus]|uniref:Cerebellin 20 n=1 Tax=Clupea harengus TaxID=7950 RepID=A0A6P8G2G5_CLUHA|nr:cerebellin 20 [Clupea harengus]
MFVHYSLCVPAVCLLDSSSCGCCLMQRQMFRMESFFNMSLTELQRDLQRAQAALHNLRASRSAFSVALTDTRRCLGPFREDTVVMYQSVFLNLGDGYSTSTGVFTAPRSGVYSLALTVYSDAGSPGATLAACARLRRNGGVLASPSEHNMQDQEDSVSVTMAVQLNAGDRVDVLLPAGCFLCDSDNHYNTFTGFLLYATD